MRRLERDGWYLGRHGSDHDIYRHPEIAGIITLPRHRTLSNGVAATDARKAAWTDQEEALIRYPALIDGEEGAYGVVFPDIPGIAAMGATIDEALVNAEEALRDYVIETEKDGDELAVASPAEAIETPPGHLLVSVPLNPTAEAKLSN